MTVGLTTYPFFNYFEAMRATIWMHRSHNEDSGTMPVATAFEMATEGQQQKHWESVILPESLKQASKLIYY